MRLILSRLTASAVFLAVVLFVLNSIFLILSRATSLSILEMNEDVCLDMASRFASKDGLYPLPSPEYLPSCYPCGYPVFSSLAFNMIGYGLPAMRLLSISSLLVLSGITGIQLAKRGLSLYWCFVSLGLFVATFEKTGYWFDLARVDMTALGLMVCAFWLLSRAHSKPAWIFGSLLLSMGVLTKHTLVLFLPAYSFLVFRTSTLWRAISVSIIPIAGFGAHFILFPHSWYYLVTLPSRQGFYLGNIELFISRPAPLLVGTALLGACFLVSRRAKPPISGSGFDEDFFIAGNSQFPLSGKSEDHLLSATVCFLAFAVFAGVLGLLKVGGSLNHFIPIAYFDAILTGLLAHRLDHSFPLLIRVLILVKLGLCFFTGSFARTQAESAKTNVPVIHSLKSLKSVNRRIYFDAMRANHLGHLAGYAPYANYQSLLDLQLAGQDQQLRVIKDAIAEKIKRREIGIVVTIADRPSEYQVELDSNYTAVDRVNGTTFGNLIILAPRQ